VAEQVERLAQKYEIHLYSMHVEGVDLSRICWRRIPALPGPHLLAYCWWFIANHLWRWWDKRFRGLRYDLTYSPGINCLDADILYIHILFSEFHRQIKDNIRLTRNPILSWPRLIHRRLYYRLIIWLERIIYPRKGSVLTAISTRTAKQMARLRQSEIPVIHHGVLPSVFNSAVRKCLRDRSRRELGFAPTAFCLLLIGNGWKNKGLETLLEALGLMRSDDLRLLVVGHDDPLPYRATIARLGLAQRVTFLPRRADVEFYYAAADVYVGPSLEDSFGVPPLEGMACGLPVIVSCRAGVSELITDGADGIVLKDPKDAAVLARVVSELQANPALQSALGENAERTAHQYTWERNAAQLDALFERVLEERRARSNSQAKARIAVVSPFLDRRHGTERRVTELVERFSRDFGHEIHIYSQQVQDIAGLERFRSLRGAQGQARNRIGTGDANHRPPSTGRVLWHKLPKVPGPHLVNYLWWFITNHLWRWWDHWFRGLRCDLVYTPGINCLDADVVSVHILFAEFYRQVRSELNLRANPLRAWPRIIHRRLYYALIIALEKIVYARHPPRLAVISKKTHDDVIQRWRRDDAIPVVYGGLDPGRFNAPRRVQMRLSARRGVGLADDAFALLMIGNDWKKKGLEYLLEALGRLHHPALRLLVAGHDSLEPYRSSIDRLGLAGQLIFLPIRPDVEVYYAAADVYVCPSLEDAFAFPPFEATACGLPVIVSCQAGVSELISDGVDGLLLRDPRNAESLAGLISKLFGDPALRSRLGENAANTASQYTWERNAEQFRALFEEVLHGKAGLCYREADA
jgi:UDP-glucose:(heptosyl)LPS alpha-1,3-glucosyltransferase